MSDEIRRFIAGTHDNLKGRTIVMRINDEYYRLDCDYNPPKLKKLGGEE